MAILFIAPLALGYIGISDEISFHAQQYLSNDHVMNTANPHGINSHINSNNAHSLGNKANSADFIAHLNLYHGGSDERLKENIADTSFGLDYINSLRPVDFQFTSESADNLFDDDDPNKTKYLDIKHGFIAQEVETVIPDLVDRNTGKGFDKDGNILYDNYHNKDDIVEYSKAVNDAGIIPILVESLKEAIAKIETLEAKVAALEAS